jgi:hypothetical protein
MQDFLHTVRSSEVPLKLPTEPAHENDVADNVEKRDRKKVPFSLTLAPCFFTPRDFGTGSLGGFQVTILLAVPIF